MDNERLATAGAFFMPGGMHVGFIIWRVARLAQAV